MSTRQDLAASVKKLGYGRSYSKELEYIPYPIWRLSTASPAPAEDLFEVRVLGKYLDGFGIKPCLPEMLKNLTNRRPVKPAGHNDARIKKAMPILPLNINSSTIATSLQTGSRLSRTAALQLLLLASDFAT